MIPDKIDKVLIMVTQTNKVKLFSLIIKLGVYKTKVYFIQNIFLSCFLIIKVKENQNL